MPAKYDIVGLNYAELRKPGSHRSDSRTGPLVRRRREAGRFHVDTSRLTCKPDPRIHQIQAIGEHVERIRRNEIAAKRRRVTSLMLIIDVSMRLNPPIAGSGAT